MNTAVRPAISRAITAICPTKASCQSGIWPKEKSMMRSVRPGMGLAHKVAWRFTVLIAGRTHGRMEASSCRRLLKFYALHQAKDTEAKCKGKEESSFLKKRSKRLLHLLPVDRSLPIPYRRWGLDRRSGGEVKVFWFFSSEKNALLPCALRH